MTASVWVAGLATCCAVWLGVGTVSRGVLAWSLRAVGVWAGVIGIIGAGWLLRSATPTRVALAAIVVLTALAATALFRRQRTSRVESEMGDRVLETTELLSAELAAGLPPGVTLQHAADAWSFLGPVAEAERLGADVPTAWRALSELTPGASDLRLVGAGWDAATRTGGGLAEATAGVATSIRANRASDRLVASELASARATSRLVAGLPIAALLMGTSEDSHPVQFLVTEPVGLVCLASGLAFGLVGLWWIEAIAGGVRR